MSLRAHKGRCSRCGFDHDAYRESFKADAPAQSALDELRREVEALRADAERYRWLREQSGTLKVAGHFSIYGEFFGMEPACIDEGIDTARASTDEGN